MNERTEAAIEIAADADEVLAVVADVEAYPEWANGIRRAEVLELDARGRPLRAAFRLEAGPVRDSYELRYTWEDSSVSWDLVSGEVLSAMTGSYAITPTDGGSRVVYRLAVDVKMPLLGVLKRRAEKAIVDTALADLKRRVELS